MLKGAYLPGTLNRELEIHERHFAQSAPRAFPGEVDTGSPSGNAIKHRLRGVERFHDKRNASRSV